MRIRFIVKKLFPPFVLKALRSLENTLYALPRFFLFWPMYLLQSSKGVYFDKGAHIFFGYYDTSPFNANNNILLATKTNIKLASPHNGAEPVLELGYYKNKKFMSIGQTHCWNWQQGCRYQWLNDSQNIIIYNDYRKNDFCSVIYSLDLDKELNILPCPVYSVDKINKTALSLDFTRLHIFRRGYGYSNKKITTPTVKTPKKEGVWALNLATKAKNLILTYEQIISCSHRSDFSESYHYLNHLCYSPRGGAFLFFHLWQKDGGRRHCRLMVANRDGTELACYAEHIRASHYCWVSETEVILTGLNEDNKLEYISIDIKTNKYKTLAKGLLNQDGHPSFIKGSKIITDTYPNRYGFQRLTCVDYEKNTQNQLSKFYIPSQFCGEVRCDLHPRLNYAKDEACVDIIYKNRRAMRVLPVVE
jgi:hypothetical protein